MFARTHAQNFSTPVARYLSEKKLRAPIVVGGVGGSGTRMVVHMLQALGVSMGSVRNASEDAMPFVSVYDNHINAYLSGRVNFPSLVDELLQALRLHRGDGYSDGINYWGWKNPRSIYLLPLLDELFEGMCFIHVVRDGIAMATSENQAQLEKHGAYVIPQEFHRLPQTERALLLWSLVNNAAADYGKLMGKRYLLLRYEDICDDPAIATVALASALGIHQAKDSGIVVYARRVRDTKMKLKTEDEAAPTASEALRRFGYPC
jgi:Sulfotransferase family